jgi:FdrA protein
LIEKPVVLCFIGLKEDLEIKSGNIFCTKNLTEAAMKVAAISKVSADIFSVLKLPDIFLSKKQNKIFGLFCGGTLCAEAENIIGGDHKFIDFGDDEYTKGKPHPMIDPQTRNQAFIKFADDPEAGVILFDIVLGYGSHPDPSGNISLVIEEISRKKKIIFIASVCGSEGDLQTYSKQVKKLQDVGVIVAPSNAIAAEMALLAIKSI